MADRHNPYIAGAPVVEKRMFFGREGVFDWIEHSLSGKYVDHILVLHGQRRVGKTSVLKHIPNRLPNKYIPVFIDLQGRVSTSLGRFLGWLAREITRALKEQGIELPRPDRKAFEEDPEYFETVFLPAIRFHLGERSLLLTFDEFDTFESTDAQEGLAIPFMAILKRLMNQPNLSFVFSIGSSGRKLENMQSAYTSFFKQALYRKISFLEPEDARQLVVKPVEGVVTYAEEAVERILGVTSRHPYFVQLICHELFSECQKNDRWRVALSDVNAILEPVVERGTVNLKFVWDEADDLEKWILAILATVEGDVDLAGLEARLKAEQVRHTRQELERSLLRLREKDVITAENDFVIYLLKMWLERNRPMEQVREELEEVNPIVNRLLEIGQEYHNKREYEEAVRSFEEALNVEESNLDARLWLGTSQLARGDYGKAISEFEAVLEVKIDDVVAQKGYCDAYLAMGDESRADGKLEEAEYAYQQVLGVNPEHQSAQGRMAELHHRRAVGAIVGGPEAAMEELEKALAYAEEEAFRRAHEELAAFLRGEQRLGDVLLSWGQAARERGLWDEAGDLLDAYREESGDEQTVSEAITEIREHVVERRKEELAHRAERLTNLGRYDQAVEVWTSYLKVSPDDSVDVQQKITELQAMAEETKQEEKTGGLSSLMRTIIAGAVVVLIGGIAWLLAQPTSPLRVAIAGPTATQTSTLIPTPTLVPTASPTHTPTPQPTTIPLRWERISSAPFIDRDQVTHIIFDPYDAEVMYAGTLNSGIYKTINGGITWSPAQEGLKGSAVSSLIVHPEDPNILYAGLMNDGGYKSTDGGQSWERMEIFENHQDTASDLTSLVFHPTEPDHIYFGTGFKVYVSTDAGTSWEKYWEPNNPREWYMRSGILQISVDQEGVVFFNLNQVSNLGDYLVFRIDPDTKIAEGLLTQTQNNDWGRLPDGIAFFLESNRIFAGNDNSLFYSDDQGNTWTDTGTQCSRAFSAGGGNMICTGGTPDEIDSISSDYGETWTTLETVPPTEPDTIAISPTNPDLIVVGGGGGVYKTTDRGQSWTGISSGIGNTLTRVIFSPADNYLYVQRGFFGDTGDLFGAPAGERDFEIVAHPPDDFEYAGGITTYIGVDGTVYRIASNGGQYIISVDISPYRSIPVTTNIHPQRGSGIGGFVANGRDVLYITDPDYQFWLSYDQGETWDLIPYQTEYSFGDIENAQNLFVSPSNPDHMYHLWSQPYYSTDGGWTWKNCGSQNDPDAFWERPGMGIPIYHETHIQDNLLSIDPRNPDHFFLVTLGSGLMVSRSENCELLELLPLDTGLDNPFTKTIARHPADPDTLYVGTANGFYISYNGGQTWGEVNDGLLGALTIYSLDVDPNNPGVVYAATPYGLFRLEDR